MTTAAFSVTTPVVTLNPFNKNMLCALVTTTSTAPVNYSYVVKGKTSDTNFTYSNDSFATDLSIPVVGLYANFNNTVTITLVDQTGAQQVLVVSINTNGQDYGQVHLTLDFTVFDQDMFDATMGQGWFVMNPLFGGISGYDKNGDIRMTGLWNWEHANLQLHNGTIQMASAWDPTSNFGLDLFQINLLGEKLLEYQFSTDYSVHHDATWDDTNGVMYTFGSFQPQGPTEGKKEAGIIFKFDNNSGELLWMRDYSPDFSGKSILNNSRANDIHFNTIQYVEKLDQLLVNCRNCSLIMGLDPATGDVLWTVDYPGSVAPFDLTKNLTVLNPETFRYPSGEHTTYVTTNSAFSAYNTENRIAISMFNNNSCEDTNRIDIEHLMEEGNPQDSPNLFAGEWFVYGIDLQARTVEMLKSVEFTGHRSVWEGCVFECGNFYTCMITEDYSFFIFDANGNIGAQALNIGEVDIVANNIYRGRIFTYDDLRSMI